MFVRFFVFCFAVLCFPFVWNECCASGDFSTERGVPETATPKTADNTRHDNAQHTTKQDARRSVSQYRDLIAKGVRSGAVYYNLGNAWARAEEPVPAVAAYLVALRYTPNDPHLKANLRTLLTNNGGIVPISGYVPEKTFFTTLFFWQNSVGYSAKMEISLLLAALTFLGGLLCIFYPSKRLKRLSVVGAILTVIAVISVTYDWYRFEKVERVIVTKNVILRKGNSEHYEPAFIEAIPFGTTATVLERRTNAWCLLRLSNGQEGWLPIKQTFPITSEVLISNVYHFERP